ncbi:MAG: YicC family protein [Oscillospiraceae bacterium]|nr:YicC family protein [Oscillospiraceae bacterium]
MISSMTGYGRAWQLIGGREITVEIKSVNHRFFEFSARVPRTCGYLEEKLKGLAYGKISRGKVDVNVSVVTLEGASSQVAVNRELAGEYLDTLRGLGEALGLSDNIRLTDIARFGDIFIVRKPAEDEEELWGAVRTVAEKALEGFAEMRRSEGEKLKNDILARISALESLTEKAEARAPQLKEEYRSRLFAKLEAVLEDKQVDEARLLTEAAVFAEKTDTTEEAVRLKSHLGQSRGLLSGSGPVGRKLDFLAQELGREANTIGSKCQDLEISRIVVDMKSEIEKIREQIQNIE